MQTESLRLGYLVSPGDVAAARRAADEFVARYGHETGMTEVNVPLFHMTDALLRGDWEQFRASSAHSETTRTSLPRSACTSSE